MKALLRRNRLSRDALLRHSTSDVCRPVTMFRLLGTSAPSTQEPPRVNPVGIQYLPLSIHSKVFKPDRKKSSLSESEIATLEQLSIFHLQQNDLYGKKTSIMPEVKFDVPDLVGKSLAEHFYKIGTFAAEPYLSKAKRFASSSAKIPPMPKPEEWIKQSSWTKYVVGEKPVAVEYPDEEDALVFDTEVLYKISDFAVLAVAVSEKAWYCWVSPWVLGETENPRQLIPLGNKENKLIIGHNVSYDRKRIKEEYDINLTNSMFVDTMSLHIAVSGMCSRQRPDWIKYNKARKTSEDHETQVESETSNKPKDSEIVPMVADMVATEEINDMTEENPWVSVSSLNSLADVGYLHCGIKHDKGVRNFFGEFDCKEVVDNFAMLVDYCARDVDVTYQVYKALFPRYLSGIPHPVNFAGLRHMGSTFLPINKSWENYIENAEKCYQDALKEVYTNLVQLAETAVALRDSPDEWKKDLWLKQLDWTITPIRMTKGTKNQPPRPVKRQKLPGYPKWYKDLFPTAESPMNITVRQRTACLLMRLQWDGRPIVWTNTYGYVFKVDESEAQAYIDNNYALADMNNEIVATLDEDSNSCYFKVPHKDGPTARCTNPMGKAYAVHFEKGILSSTYEIAAKAIKISASCSYWEHNRERVKGQMTVWSDDTDMGIPVSTSKDFGMIIPSLIPMGTVTRRAVENTWLTASNAKKNRIGSEQKAMVQAPPGYKFVGADVDSEELWIASLIGDSLFKIHGGTALGWMTLEGTKSEGTDLHSKTASILGISRNEAKVFNYGRIYGAGVKFASQLLREFNPSISDSEADATARKLYSATKGTKASSKVLNLKNFWRNGSESLIFNRLEDLAEQDKPKTPVLGASITEALIRKNLKQSSFMTSRINWTIQSSGVDYLHLLITSMHYLISKYKIQARLFITVHDEIRFMVKEEDVDRTALALQISNMWTRAMFSEQVGIKDLPYSCAFFSAVDVDHVLRKEVDLDCVTLSHPNPIEHGYSMDIFKLTENCTSLDKDGVSKEFDYDFKKIKYTPRPSVVEQIDQKRGIMLPYIGAQVARSAKELREVEFLSEHPELSWDLLLDKSKKLRVPKLKGKAKSKDEAVPEASEVDPMEAASISVKKASKPKANKSNKKADVRTKLPIKKFTAKSTAVSKAPPASTQQPAKEDELPSKPVNYYASKSSSSVESKSTIPLVFDYKSISSPSSSTSTRLPPRPSKHY